MKLQSLRTVQRKRKSLERRLAEERRQLYGAYLDGNEDRKRPKLEEYSGVDAQTEPSSSGINPRVRKHTDDDVHSSDSDNASVHIADEVRRIELQELYLRNVDPAATDTSSSDEISDRNDAAAGGFVSIESEDDDAVGSDVEDFASTESSSSASNDDDPLSPIQADFDRDVYAVDKVRRYLHTVAGDTVMFHESDVKCWQVVLVVLGLCTRFSLNKAANRGVINAIKLFAGPRFATWDITDYYMSKIIDPPDEITQYHFYCELCCQLLEPPVSKGRFKNHSTMCQTCKKNYALTIDSPNSFVSLDLEYQIRSLLRLKEVNEDLASNLETLAPDVSRSPDYIRDVYDGSLYKKVLSETPTDSRLLTCGFNTDGAPLFNSSKRAMWPVLLIINELSPRIRFRYPLLAGMCIVRKEPSPDLMNTYMRAFVKALKTLGTIGFEVEVGGKTVHFVLKPLFCAVDSVARPLLQNRLQFNGYYSCSWCYSKGEHVKGCMRFLMEEPDPPKRTHRDYLADVQKAVRDKRQGTGKKKCNVRGIRGTSVLTLLETFDMVWGFSRDYLHADLIGVLLQLINMWSDPNCPVRLTKSQMDLVNERLMRMTPPHEVHRLVRPLKTKKCKWKASEWRSLLLFYLIPCLTGILDDYALQHVALYVNSIFLLLQNNISETDLIRAENDLERFVIIFEMMYGARYVTFNVHTVKHAVDSVRCCGPLWATSAFPFESTIRDLKQCVQGAKSVGEQISKKTIQRNVYRSLLDEPDASPAYLNFHRSLFGRREVASFDRSAGSVVFLGSAVPYTGAAPQFRNVPDCEIKAFKRCISSGTIIHSAGYDKETLESDDTIFRTATGKFLQVLYLLKYRETAYAEVVCLGVEKMIVRCEPQQCADNPEIGDVAIEHLVRVVTDNGNKLIRVQSLGEKCVVVRVDEQTYISRLPNTVEIQ